MPPATARRTRHPYTFRPTSAEIAAQVRAFEEGGKPLEVLVKAARDVVLAGALYASEGPGPHGVRRFTFETMATRFRAFAVTTGDLPADNKGSAEDTARTATEVLARYT